jgi:hypothetical protein
MISKLAFELLTHLPDPLAATPNLIEMDQSRPLPHLQPTPTAETQSPETRTLVVRSVLGSSYTLLRVGAVLTPVAVSPAY